ncbi:MAG: hypothetical protein JSV16_13595 [Candidatus Hydrogenedentota bacterium]|nr:MAG: hypothetical protein JSV16_13595 [Candidatus Hydrogenedentota bacterium]
MPASTGITGLVASFFLLAFLSSEASAENRLYHLRVTLRGGERYETISTFDPINYCHANGGSVVCVRDYSLIYSAEMKVRILRTWIDPDSDLAGRWREVLRANNMLSNNNHKPLPRVPPLTLRDMQRPE